MHLLCNAYWLDTDALQGCDLPKIKTATYGFNQNADVEATLPPSPLNNFCASAKHNSSPNTYSIDSASLVSPTGDCGKAQAIAITECKDPCCVARLRGEPTEEVCKYETCENAAEELNKKGYRETYIPREYWEEAGSSVSQNFLAKEGFQRDNGFSDNDYPGLCVSFRWGSYFIRRPGIFNKYGRMQYRANPILIGVSVQMKNTISAIKSFLVDRGEGIGVGCANLDPNTFRNPNRTSQGFGYAMPGGETRDLTSGCGMSTIMEQE